MIEGLIGIAIEFVAARATVCWLEHTTLPAREIAARHRELELLPPMTTTADRLMLCERFQMLDTMMQVIRQGTSHLEEMSRSPTEPPKGNRFMSRLFTRSINWDPALRNVNQWMDRCAAVTRIADRAARQGKYDQIKLELLDIKDAPKRFGAVEKLAMGPTSRGERMGNVLIALLMPAFEKLRTAEDRNVQVRRNLDITFALAAYRRDNGRYPDELAALAPKYLDVIPDDLFTGGLLVYRREGDGYALYSLGPDGIDDEGRGTSDTPRGDDVGFRVPVPDPRDKE